MLVFLTESAKVQRARITKSTHNICVAWDLREARWSLRRAKKVEKERIQQSSSTVGTQLEFNLERGEKGANRPSSEESERERENSKEKNDRPRDDGTLRSV